MAVNVILGNTPYEAISHSVTEDSTPLAGGDSSGGVGTFTITLAYPDADLDPDNPILVLGTRVLENSAVILQDDTYGLVTGKVDTVNLSVDGATIEVSGTTTLGGLNAYNVQAKPFKGTLEAAFSYYCGLVGLTGSVANEIANRPVEFPGFEGELWFYMKQMSAALNTEISLAAGVISLRPIRGGELVPYYDTSVSHTINSDTLAQSVEIYLYQSEWVSPGLVYPVGGWNEDVEVISVSAGEYIEHEIELDASLLSVEQPTMVQHVSRDHVSSSVYSVVADDGFPILPAQWTDAGGRLTVEIGKDTKSLIVKIQAPDEFRISDGTLTQSFDIAMGADSRGSRYSSLRIRGTGLVYEKKKLVLPTGVPAEVTGTEVGITIDNPFISSLEMAYEAGGWAAARFGGSAEKVTLASTLPVDDAATYGFVNGSRVQVEGRPFRVRTANITPDIVSVEADYDGTVGDFEDRYEGMTVGEISDELAKYPQYNDEVGASDVVLKPSTQDVFPRRNLPGSAETWGRVIEDNVKRLNSTAEILTKALGEVNKRFGVEAEITADAKANTKFIWGEVEGVQDELSQVSSQMDEDLNELNEVTLPAINDELDAMESILEGVQGDLVDVNAELDAMEQALTDVQGDLVDVQGEIETANQNAQDALDAATAAETTASGANARMSGTGANGPATRTNGAALIQGDEYVRVNSSGQAIGVQVWNGSAWVPQQILADSVLVPGSAGSTVIADGAITTDKIVANAITGDKVAANSITASRLVVGDGDNFIVDPYLIREDLLDYRIAQSAGSWTPLTSTQIPGATYVYAPPSSNNQAFRLITPEVDGSASYPPVVAGRKYNIRFRVSGGGPGSPGVGVDEIRVAVRERKADGSTTYLAVGNWIKVPSNVFTWVDYQWEVPSDTIGAQFDLQVRQGNVGNVSFATPIVTAMTGTTLIEDGAITTDKITANAITGDKVAANTLTASKLVIGNADNLIQDPEFIKPDIWSSLPSGVSFTTGGYNGKRRITIAASSTQSGVYTSNSTVPDTHDNMIPVTPGESYYVEAWARGGAVISKGTSRAAISGRFHETQDSPAFGITLIAGAQSDIPTGTWGKVSGIFTVPSNASYMDVGFFKQAAMNAEVWWSAPVLRKAVGTTLIEDGAITTPKLVTGSVTADKVGANAISTDKLVSNAVTAAKLASNSVLARHLDIVSTDSSGKRMTLDADGIKIWADGEYENEPAIRLGIGQDDYLAFAQNGNVTMSLSPNGEFTGGNVNASGSLQYQGQDVLDLINSTAGGAVLWADQSVRGRSAYVSAAQDAYIELGEVAWDVEQGRTYQIYVHPISVYGPTGAWVRLRTSYTSNGSSPTRSSTPVGSGAMGAFRTWGSSSQDMIPIGGGSHFWTPNFTGTVRMLFFIHASTDSTTPGRVNIFDSNLGGMLAINVVDMGTRDFSGNQIVNRTGIVSADPAENNNPTPPPQKKTTTQTWNANGAESYRGNGSKATGYVWAGTVAQGSYSTISAGNLRGLWTFPTSIATTLNGATVNKVELYVKNDHTYANAGATGYFHSHGHTSIPATYSAGTSNTFNSHFSRGQGKWITLPNAYGTGLRSGAIRGIGMYTTGGANYGYWNSNARLRITYTK